MKSSCLGRCVRVALIVYVGSIIGLSVITMLLKAAS